MSNLTPDELAELKHFQVGTFLDWIEEHDRAVQLEEARWWIAFLLNNFGTDARSYSTSSINHLRSLGIDECAGQRLASLEKEPKG